MRFFLSLLLVAPCLADDAPRPPTDAEIRESKVFDAIGEMTVRRDELLKKFAVVMHGESVATRKDKELCVLPLVNARISDKSREFDLRAFYQVIKDQGPHFEGGSVTIQIGQEHKAIDFNPFVSPVLVKPKGTKLSAWQLKHPSCGGADPYDDYLSGATMYFCVNPGAIENGILRRYKLVKTETGLGGKLISHWTMKVNEQVDWKIRMEFDPAYEMMPVRVQVENQAIKHDFQDTRITWRKHGKTLLPHRIEYAHGSMGNKEDTSACTFRCYWLVGDEVPDEVFESDNHLGTLLDHFEIDHTRRVDGDVVPFQHQFPKDLFEDEL